jgi:hypothetical protein
VHSMRQTMAIRRVKPRIQIAYPGPRLSPLRRAKAVLKPEMMLTT